MVVVVAAEQVFLVWGVMEPGGHRIMDLVLGKVAAADLLDLLVAQERLRLFQLTAELAEIMAVVAGVIMVEPIAFVLVPVVQAQSA
jgi:hypothetical protein